MNTAKENVDTTDQSEPPRKDSSRHRIARRDFMKFASGSAAAAALGACSSRTLIPTTSISERARLVYQDWRTDWFPELAQNMLGQFQETNPSIQVFYSPDPENLLEQMAADFQSGTAPDVMAGCCEWFASWAQQGNLLDLRPFVEADLEQSVVNDWDPAQYSALFTQDGLQFALPKYHGALGLYYNKDLFDEYGVDYPTDDWTHEDYRRAMQQLTHDRSGDGKIDLWGSMMDIAWERLQVHVNAWGGHFVNPEDPSRSLMAQPESLAAMEWIRARIWDDRIMAGFLDVQNMETRQAFLNGHIAMVEDGSWALKDILENADFALGVTTFPAGPARKVTLATTDGFGIYAGTRHPEAAWELLKFLVSRDYGRAMAEAHLLQPARASLVGEWIELIRRAYPEKTKDMALESFADGHENGYSVTAEIFADMEAARQLAQPAWQKIFTLGQGSVEDLVQVSARIDLAQPRED